MDGRTDGRRRNKWSTRVSKGRYRVNLFPLAAPTAVSSFLVAKHAQRVFSCATSTTWPKADVVGLIVLSVVHVRS